MRIEWCGEELELLPERALHIPARALHMPARGRGADPGVLIVADAHFGKDSHFRGAGLPVPSGTTEHDLARLERALTRTGANRLVFLGDFLHAIGSRGQSTFEPLHAWRASRRDLGITLVRGNHDKHAGDPPASLGIDVVDEPFECGAFTLVHAPSDRHRRPSIAGHVHPGMLLLPPAGVARARALKLACFVFDADQALIPAFGGFTGLAMIDPAPARRFYAIAGESVVRAG